MKKSFKFVVMMWAVILMACGGKNSQPADNQQESGAATVQETAVEAEKEEVTDEGVKAPDVAADDHGFISLAQCPTEDPHLKVVIDENVEMAQIFRDGQPIQTIGEKDTPLVGAGGNDAAAIHFMDANFDGYADIFIGPGESRTYSTLLLWKPQEKQFFRVGELGNPSLQNILLSPADKTVYESGSSSWCNYDFSKSVWNGDQLKVVEELNIVSDEGERKKQQVDVYTWSDLKTGKKISVPNAADLPGKWKEVVGIYDMD